MSVKIPAGDSILGALMRVPVDYVIEAHSGGLGLVQAMPLPNTPSELTLETMGSADHQYTLGSSKVRWNKIRNRTITLSGRSGIDARTGMAADGGLIYQPGPKLVEEFEKWINKIHEEFKRTQDYKDSGEGEEFISTAISAISSFSGVAAKVLSTLAHEDPYLVFRAYSQGIHARCKFEGFSRASSANSSRHSYEWQLRLKLYQKAEPVPLLNVLAPVSKYAQKAADAIDNGNAYIGAAGNLMVNLRGDLDSLRAPLQALERTGAAVQDVVAGARSVAEFPRDALADLTRAAARFNLAAQDALDLWEYGTGLEDQYVKLKQAMGLGQQAFDESVTTAGGLGVYTGFESNLDDIGVVEATPLYRQHRRRVTLSNVRQTFLRGSEDLRDVALREMGLESAWRTLAWLNGWRGPSQRGSGAQARVGDPVLVPQDPGVGEIGSSDPLDPMGSDLYFGAETRDFEIEGDDFREVSGDANALQALRERMTTPQGDWRVFREYGLPMALGGTLTPRSAATLSVQVEEQLLSDYRVAEVLNPEVIDYGATLAISATINLSDGRSLPLIVPFPSTD